MTTAAEVAGPITAEQYVAMMQKWIRVSGHRTIRKESGSLFTRADVEQDAVVALMETWTKFVVLSAACPTCGASPVIPTVKRVGNREVQFAPSNCVPPFGPSEDRVHHARYDVAVCAKPIHEMQAIGRRAIWYHTGGDGYYHHGNHAPRCPKPVHPLKRTCPTCRATPGKWCAGAGAFAGDLGVHGARVDPDLRCANCAHRFRKPCSLYGQLTHLEDLTFDADAAEARDSLDRLIVKEAVVEVARESDVARHEIALAFTAAVARGGHDGELGVDARSRRLIASLSGAEKIFFAERPESVPDVDRRTARLVRNSVSSALGRGILTGVNSTATTSHREDGMRDGETGGPLSPDEKGPETSGAAAGTPPAATSGEKKAPRAAKATGGASTVGSVKKSSQGTDSAREGRLTPAQMKALAQSFKKDDAVEYLGGGRAAWLKKGSMLVVRGTVMSRGKMYLRAVVIASKKKISLKATLVKKVAK